MNQAAYILRQTTAGMLATLVLALSVAMPVLEQEDLVTQQVLESQHAPGDCPQAHDHTVCTQLRSNGAAPATMAVHWRLPLAVTAVFQTPEDTPVVALFREGHPSRAPPLV